MDIYNRVNYLQTVAQELSKEDNLDKLKLASFFGYTKREICLKNQIPTFGWDPIKRSTCKRCFSPLVINKDGYDPVKFKIVKKFLHIKCKQCGKDRRIKLSNQRKNYYEKLIYGDGSTTTS